MTAAYFIRSTFSVVLVITHLLSPAACIMIQEQEHIGIMIYSRGGMDAESKVAILILAGDVYLRRSFCRRGLC